MSPQTRRWLRARPARRKAAPAANLAMGLLRARRPPAPPQPPAVAATADERGTPRTTPSALPGAPAAIRPAAASPRWAPARVLMPAYAQRPEELRSAPPCGR